MEKLKDMAADPERVILNARVRESKKRGRPPGSSKPGLITQLAEVGDGAPAITQFDPEMVPRAEVKIAVGDRRAADRVVPGVRQEVFEDLER